MVEKIIVREDGNDKGLTIFIKIDDISYLRPYKKDNWLNTKASSDDVAEPGKKGTKMYMSVNGGYLIIEKSICINSIPSSNRYVGRGKKFISVTENANNLIKALSYGWRYGKMLIEGIAVRKIMEQEHKGDRSVYRYLSLNYLSPNIVNDLMESNVPSHINLQALFQIASRYKDFKDKERVFYSKRS
jgi:hypothetical protein